MYKKHFVADNKFRATSPKGENLWQKQTQNNKKQPNLKIGITKKFKKRTKHQKAQRAQSPQRVARAASNSFDFLSQNTTRIYKKLANFKAGFNSRLLKSIGLECGFFKIWSAKTGRNHEE